MEESGDEPDFLALAVSEDDRGLQDAPDVMGDDSELEGEPDFLLALAPGILENAPLPAGISLPPPPSWRRMGSFHFLLAFRFHQHSASPAPELALDGRSEAVHVGKITHVAEGDLQGDEVDFPSFSQCFSQDSDHCSQKDHKQQRRRRQQQQPQQQQQQQQQHGSRCGSRLRTCACRMDCSDECRRCSRCC